MSTGRADPVADIVAFGTCLRDEGLGVDATRLLAFAQACRLTSMQHAYWAGRATLLSRQADTSAYDRAFFAHFGSLPRADNEQSPPPAGASAEPRIEPGEDDAGAERSASPASAIEVLRHKRFDECTEEELREIAALVARISWALPPRRSRRRRAALRGRPDVRRTLHHTVRTHGEDWAILHHRRHLRRRPLLLLLDVSGSMAASSRTLLTFSYGVLKTDTSWEAFGFGTRLTRLTPALRAHSPEAALAAASTEADDWRGGTRIGASLKALLDGWGQSRSLRGATVVMCSDGLEVGDPRLLGEQMARLARTARTVVWLNPLKGLEGYAPLARGMRAALPHVDVFAAGDTLAALEEIAARLALVTRRAAP